MKITQFDLGFGCAKDGATNYESLALSMTPIRNKRSTSFWKIYSCTFGTGYGIDHIGFISPFNSKYTVSVFQMLSVTFNNSSNFCNNFDNSLCYTSVRCWYWFYITLFKSDFYYSASKIKRNCLEEVQTCFD